MGEGAGAGCLGLGHGGLEESAVSQPFPSSVAGQLGLVKSQDQVDRQEDGITRQVLASAHFASFR